MSTPDSVTGQAARSVKWSALMEIVSRTVSPVVFVILARLLTPEDFGVATTAMMAISFSQMFWDAGLGKALVQTKETPEKAADVVFWANLVLGIGIYAVLFLAAPWLAVFFNSPASLPVLRVLGVQVVIASLTSVQQALFVRNLGFQQLFWVKLATACVPGLFSIPLAFLGQGVWALVAGSLAGSVFNTALLWKVSAWRPRMRFNWYLACKLFRFGIWVVGESLMAWLIMWGDNLLVGRFLGVQELGVYRVGWTICTIIFGLLLNPFLPVLYPTFSRLQDDAQTLRATFHRVNRVVISLALPIGTGLLLIGPELASGLFGSKWHGLGLVLSVIGFLNGVAWLVGINPDLYRAIGRPDVNTKLMFVTILYYLPAYLIAAPLGLEVFTFVRLGVALVAIPIHIYLCVRMLGVLPLYLWHDGRPMILAVLAMAVVVTGTKWVFTVSSSQLPEFATLIVLILTGILAYGATLWLLDRPFILQTKTLLQRAVLT